MAAAHLIVLTLVLAFRLSHPFDIEWMESGTLVEAWRLRQGLPLYVAPSAEFIPFPYTPLHPVLLAWLSRLLFLPVSYALGRALSIAALAGGCWAIWRAVRAEGGRRAEAVASCGVLAGGFAFTGGWFDLIRADSLYLALATAGFATLRLRGTRWRGVACGAVLLALAFFTKQTAMVFLGAGALALIFVRARLVPLYVGVAGGVVALGSAWLQWTSDGWFQRWAFDVLDAHSVQRDVLLGRAWVRMLGDMWPLALLAVIAWVAAARERERRPGLAFWTVFAVAGLLAAAVGASIQWSVENVYLPALYGAVLMAGVSAAVIRRAAPPAWWFAPPLLIALQLALSIYDPRRHVPGEQTAKAERFISRLASLPGEVLVPYHPFAAVGAGKRPALHLMALGAAERGGMATPSDLRRAIAEQRYDAVVLDRPLPKHLNLWSTYRVSVFLPAEDRPRTFSGFITEPRYLLVPKRAEPPAPGVVTLIDFESGSWNGWEITGDAFGPVPNGGPALIQAPVGPFGGLYFANSGNPTVHSLGRALSPEFEIPASPLRLLVGGANSALVSARLLVGGEEVRSANGEGDDELRPVEWVVEDLVGRRARLELIDEDPDGYLLADDLTAPLR